MKKLFWVSGVFSILLSTTACEGTKTKEESAETDKTRVVNRDSVATEYEVTETVVEYDTTKRVKKVEAKVNQPKDRD